MLEVLEVDCISSDGSIGGKLKDGSRWKKSLSQAILGIKRGEQICVRVGDEVAEVEVYTRKGKEFLRTKRDKTRIDNLENLPRCPDQKLNDVRLAIKEKGLKWTAGKTSRSQLSLDEKKNMLGYVPKK
jgi:hypothetical protein